MRLSDANNSKFVEKIGVLDEKKASCRCVMRKKAAKIASPKTSNGDNLERLEHIK